MNNMKKLRKIFALLIAMVMVLGMSTMAFAQEAASTETGGSATIKVTNPAKGETYTVYKIFDATVTGTENGSISYKGNIPAALSEYFEKIGSTDYVQKKEGVTDQQILTAIQDNASSFTQVATVTSDGSQLTFTGLNYGYYVIATSHEDDTAGKALVTVTSTNPNAEIQDKNANVPTVPEDGKTVNDEDVAVGETLTYTLKFTTTTYEGAGSTAKQILSYIATDTLPEYLSNVTVTGITIGGDAYTVDGEVPQFENKKIVIPWVDDATAENPKSLYANGAEVVITYTAVVNDKIAIAGAGNTNTFTLTYRTTDGEKTPDQNTDTVTIKSYAIAIKKVNDEGTALPGATFQFPFYVNETAAADGSYVYAGTTAGEGLTNEITTPDSGEIVVKGVASGTYSVSETAAPQGYNQLTAPVSVPATVNSETTTNTTWYLDENGEVTDTETETVVTYTNNNLSATATVVVNKVGTTLPSTGGIGTTIFYIIGAILVIGAGVVLVTRRRMNAN